MSLSQTTILHTKLCQTKAHFAHLRSQWGLSITHKYPFITVTLELSLLWPDSCWMMLVQALAKVLQLTDIQCCGGLAGRCLLGNLLCKTYGRIREEMILYCTPRTWTEVRKAVCEVIKYWSGNYFSGGIFPPETQYFVSHLFILLWHHC